MEPLYRLRDVSTKIPIADVHMLPPFPHNTDPDTDLGHKPTKCRLSLSYILRAETRLRGKHIQCSVQQALVVVQVAGDHACYPQKPPDHSLPLHGYLLKLMRDAIIHTEKMMSPSNHLTSNCNPHASQEIRHQNDTALEE